MIVVLSLITLAVVAATAVSAWLRARDRTARLTGAQDQTRAERAQQAQVEGRLHESDARAHKAADQARAQAESEYTAREAEIRARLKASGREVSGPQLELLVKQALDRAEKLREKIGGRK